jgi:DNA-binding NarL/FixJ family response regulator
MQSPARYRIKVLITDDHSLFRTGVKNSLKKYSDIEVIGEAENGQDLLNKLEFLSPDVISLNLQMPVLNGLETLPLLRKNYPGIKIVMLSMHNDPNVICKMLEEGAHTYVTKESDPDELYKAIVNSYKKWFYINETVMKAINQRKSPVEPKPSPTFSTKEVLVMEMLKKDTPIAEMATILELHSRTVEAIIDKLKGKAAVKSKAGLVIYAVRNKLI